MNTPIPAFKYAFQVALDGVTDNSNEYFYSVDGLGITYQLDKYLPGGYGNSYAMPTTYETRPLVLKRPIIQEKTSITKWCETALEGGVFKPTTVNIFILNVERDINNHWAVHQAYPIAWKISSLDLEPGGNAIIVETITLGYVSLKRVQ